MPKYIVKEESLIDKLVGAIFGSVAKQAKSKALKQLSANDPEFAKKVKELEKNRKDMGLENRSDSKRAIYCFWNRCMF